MSPFVLSLMKYALLALLYLFVFVAVRSVVADVRQRREAETARRTQRPGRAERRERAGRVPSSVVVHQREGGKARTYRLSEPLDVGRDEACRVRVEDTYVSQVHARLYGKNGAWFVEDLGSTNGTYLNDRRLQAPAEVRVGDVVRVGKTLLELRR